MSEDNVIISLYLDDELSLEEKRDFAVRCSHDPAFLEETLSLLEQEKLLRSDASDILRPVPDGSPKPALRRRLRPMSLLAAGLALAVIGLSIPLLRRAQAPPAGPAKVEIASHRFVLYEPRAAQVEIAGDFTGWRKLDLEPLPRSGYWVLTMELPPGSHRYTFFIDGDRKVEDPTARSSESDDFGGRNSILVAGAPL